MTTRTTLADPIAEQSTAIITANIVDEAGVAIPAADLHSLTLTLFRKGTRNIVNSRNAQNVLNANNVTVDSAGLLTWSMQPADNIISNGASTEAHIAQFCFTWSGGAKIGRYEIEYDVCNFEFVS